MRIKSPLSSGVRIMLGKQAPDRKKARLEAYGKKSMMILAKKKGENQ